MKDLLSATLARIVVVGMQLVYVKLYSNVLETHELGVYFFLITVSYSFNAFVFVPLDYYQQAKLYGYIKNNISLKTMVNFNLKCIAMAAALMVIIALTLAVGRPEYVIEALVAAMLSIALYISTTLKGTLNNLEHRRFVSAVMAGEAVLKVLFFVGFASILPRTAITLMCSMVAALAVTTIPLASRMRKLPVYVSGKIEQVDPSDVFKFGYPVSIGAIINWVQLQGYRLVLVPLGFADTVGIYATVSGIGTAGINAASAIFAQVFLPKIYKSSGAYTKTYLRNALALVVGIFLFSAAASTVIVTSLTKAEFRRYSWLILYGVLAEAGNFLVGALSVHLTLVSRTRKMLIASLIGLLCVIGGFLLLYVTNFISLATIGLPIVFSQLAVACYLYWIRDHGHAHSDEPAHA